MVVSFSHPYYEQLCPDPTITNPEFYRALWENDDVRVLKYRDAPGQETTPHEHPNTAHSGRNTGATPTHTILVELKHSAASGQPAKLGPVT